jgi:WS/DGAT/MGAT family acyltransferase
MTEPSKIVMNAVDRAWLEMDEPGNPMVIGALLELDGPVDAAAFQQALVERLLRYPRFRQVADRSNGIPCWVSDHDLDFRYHVRVRRLPAAGFERHLRKAVSEETSRDLDPARPLWRLILFPRAGGPVTVLFRVHHAVADGIALVTLLIDSTDGGQLRAARPAVSHTWRHPHRGPLGGMIDRLEDVNKALERLAGLGGELRQPRKLLRRMRDGRATLDALQRVLRLPDNRPADLRKPLSGQRRVAWIGGIPFAPVRRTAHRLEVRVNDVFMAALAGALGRQLGAAGAPSQELRVSIPVNLRRGRGRELGNQFGLVLLDLPVGVDDPLQRLRLVSRRMAELKSSLEAKVTLLGLAAAGHLPMPLEKKLVGMIAAKSAAVVSNLPGPARHVRIAGARMKSLVFWPPQAGGMGIGISFFTYGGELTIGISADRNLLPGPQLLIQAFREELERIAAIKTPRTGSAAQPEPATVCLLDAPAT